MPQALSAYMIYANANRERVKGEHPEAIFGQIGAILNDEYNQLSHEARAIYERQAETDRKRLEDEETALEAREPTNSTASVESESRPSVEDVSFTSPSYLLSLPRELQLRILDHFSGPPFSCCRPVDSPPSFSSQTPQFLSLVSLSRTNHSLRDLALPLTWRALNIDSIRTLARLRDFPLPARLLREALYPGSPRNGLPFTHWVRELTWEWNWRDIESDFWECDEREGVGLGMPLEYAFLDRGKWYSERRRVLEEERRERGGSEEEGWIMEGEPLVRRSGPDGQGRVQGMQSMKDVERALKDVLLPTVRRLRSIVWGPSILPLPQWFANAVMEGQREEPVLETLDLCFDNLHWEAVNSAVPLLPSINNLRLGDDGSHDRDPGGVVPCTEDVGPDGYPSWLVADDTSVFGVRFAEDANILQIDGIRGDPSGSKRLKHSAWVCEILLGLAEIKLNDPIRPGTTNSNKIFLDNLTVLDFDVLLARPLLPLLLAGIETLRPEIDSLNIPIETNIFVAALCQFRSACLSSCKQDTDSYPFEHLLTDLITKEYTRLLSTPEEKYFPISYWHQTPDSEPSPACAKPVSREISPWVPGASFAFPIAKIRALGDSVMGRDDVMEMEEVRDCVGQSLAMFASWLRGNRRLGEVVRGLFESVV